MSAEAGSFYKKTAKSELELLSKNICVRKVRRSKFDILDRKSAKSIHLAFEKDDLFLILFMVLFVF